MSEIPHDTLLPPGIRTLADVFSRALVRTENLLYIGSIKPLLVRSLMFLFGLGLPSIVSSFTVGFLPSNVVAYSLALSTKRSVSRP